MKNVPLPCEKEYKIELLNSIHNFDTRMRWRAFHFLNPNSEKTRKETYNLNTTNPPPPIKELKYFQDGLCEIAKNIQFRKVNNNKFQNKLKDDLKAIKDEEKVIVAADKTRNYYKMEKERYKDLLNNNITKDYKKVDDNVITDITKDDNKLGLSCAKLRGT